jgi:hypothetical protein
MGNSTKITVRFHSSQARGLPQAARPRADPSHLVSGKTPSRPSHPVGGKTPGGPSHLVSGKTARGPSHLISGKTPAGPSNLASGNPGADLPTLQAATPGADTSHLVSGNIRGSVFISKPFHRIPVTAANRYWYSIYLYLFGCICIDLINRNDE